MTHWLNDIQKQMVGGHLRWYIDVVVVVVVDAGCIAKP